MQIYEQMLDDIAGRSASGLVPGASVQHQPVDQTIGGTDLVAVIGFSGDVARGSLGVSAPSAVIAATHPAIDDAAPTREQLEDWLAEFSNQLLGRLKGELIQRNVPVWMSTPLVLRGVKVRVVSSNERVRQYRMRTPHGDFTFWLDLECPPELLGAPDATAEHYQAGEMLLF